VPAVRYAFLDGPTPLAMAHRGGAIEYLENTMPAFQACVDLGYHYLETDVQVTADGVLVAFHDPTLERVTDRSGRVDSLTWSEVSAARIGGREPVVALEDLLGAWPDVRFNLDIKAAGVLAPLVRTVHRLKAVDRICLASFSDARIAAARRLFGPSLCTSLGPRGVAALRLSSYSPRAAGLVRIQAARRSLSSWAVGPWSTSASWPPPMHGDCRCTSGPWTASRRARRCSTWGSTG
jgi:glycerophosphoryl diester phosphodiesterase